MRQNVHRRQWACLWPSVDHAMCLFGYADTCDFTGKWTQKESPGPFKTALECTRKPCKGYPATDAPDYVQPDPHTACKADPNPKGRTDASTQNGEFEDKCTAVCSGRDGKGYIGNEYPTSSPDPHAGEIGYQCASHLTASIYVPGRSKSASDPGFGATQDECEKLCGGTDGCKLWQWGHGQDYQPAHPHDAWCYLLTKCGGPLKKDTSVRVLRSKPSATCCLCCQPLSEISR